MCLHITLIKVGTVVKCSLWKGKNSSFRNGEFVHFSLFPFFFSEWWVFIQKFTFRDHSLECCEVFWQRCLRFLSKFVSRTQWYNTLSLKFTFSSECGRLPHLLSSSLITPVSSLYSSLSLGKFCVLRLSGLGFGQRSLLPEAVAVQREPRRSATMFCVRLRNDFSALTSHQ